MIRVPTSSSKSGFSESAVDSRTSKLRELKMIDVSLRGVRCRAAQEILDSDGTVGIATEGTIVYELEGEGGQLVNVQWDTGTTSLVSSEEIEITDGSVSWQ
jgi:transposase